MKITERKLKQFRKNGGSHYIAIKQVLGGLDINTKDSYEVIHSKDSVTIKKVK